MVNLFRRVGAALIAVKSDRHAVGDKELRFSMVFFLRSRHLRRDACPDLIDSAELPFAATRHQLNVCGVASDRDHISDGDVQRSIRDNNEI